MELDGLLPAPGGELSIASKVLERALESAKP
jgi:hypothetical protein